VLPGLLLLLLLLPLNGLLAALALALAEPATTVVWAMAFLRKLALSAVALGHDRVNRMRRTARLDALLRARVKDKPPSKVDVAVVVEVSAVVSPFELALLLLLPNDDDDDETSVAVR
jgi:hypothetical protein